MRRAGMRRAAVVLALASGGLGRPAVAQDATWALTNARIETVTRGVIERGTIVIRNGLIAAVGADVTPPPDARVLDLAGRTVYPGLIDLTSTIGLPAAPATAAGPGGGGGAAAAQAQQAQRAAFVGLEPERMVADEFRAQQNDIRSAREAGITAVLTAPSRGAFRGQSALVPLRDSVTAEQMVRAPVALHMGFEGVGGGFGGGRYPATLLGVIAYERQKFYDARRQALLIERYRSNPRGMARPANDPSLTALIPAVQGQLPVFFAAGNENEIRRALGIAREFNLQMTIVGATEGFRALDALTAARRPVVVSVDFPRSTDVTGWAYRAAQRGAPDSATADTAVRHVVEGNAAALNRAGVRFALASGGRSTDFLANVRKAVAAGLPRDTALAAVTIRAAEVAGAGDQLGSIETGKIANLVVSEGDLLGDSARVRMVFVDGIRYTVEVAAAARGGAAAGRGARGAGGGADMAEIAGTWDLTINSPQGAQQSSMTVTQSGGSFSGSMSSQLGTTDISGGSINGRQVAWSLSISMGGQSMTLNYSAEVTGTRMSGTVSVGDFGSFPFTGEKRP